MSPPGSPPGCGRTCPRTGWTIATWSSSTRNTCERCTRFGSPSAEHVAMIDGISPWKQRAMSVSAIGTASPHPASGAGTRRLVEGGVELIIRATTSSGNNRSITRCEMPTVGAAAANASKCRCISARSPGVRGRSQHDAALPLQRAVVRDVGDQHGRASAELRVGLGLPRHARDQDPGPTVSAAQSRDPRRVWRVEAVGRREDHRNRSVEEGADVVVEEGASGS